MRNKRNRRREKMALYHFKVAGLERGRRKGAREGLLFHWIDPQNPLKSNYRMVADESWIGMLGLVTGSRYFCRGVLTAMALEGTALVAQVPSEASVPDRQRIVSEKVSHAVIEKLPKFEPPTAVTPTEPRSDESSDESTDGILRLPKMTVRAAAPVAPPEFAWLSPKGRLALAIKSNPGIRVGNIFGLNNGIAMAMQTEQREVQKKAVLTDSVQRTKSDDSPESRKIDRLLKAALQRPNSDWLGGGWGR